MNLIFERFFPKFTQVRLQAIPQLSSENGEQIKLNKRFRIVRILMFPVAALIIKSFSLLPSIEKINCLTNDFHGKFYAKNRNRMNYEAMSVTLVFPVKFTLQFTSLAIIFS